MWPSKWPFCLCLNVFRANDINTLHSCTNCVMWKTKADKTLTVSSPGSTRWGCGHTRTPVALGQENTSFTTSKWVCTKWLLWYIGISMASCKKDVTPLLTHWSYIFLAQTHRFLFQGSLCTWSFEQSAAENKIGSFLKTFITIGPLNGIYQKLWKTLVVQTGIFFTLQHDSRGAA